MKIKTLESSFKFFKAIFVPREKNTREDLLAKLASTKNPEYNRTVSQEVIYELSTEAMDVHMVLGEEGGLMNPLIKYLIGAFVPKNEEETLVRRRSSKFTMVAGKLYRMGKATAMLRCPGESETNLVLLEVHEGVCGTHIGRRALVAKLLRAGYYWPTLL